MGNQGKKADKRTRILNAMLELVTLDKGVSATVSEVAARAGIGKGSVYYYFASKEEIVDALVERVYDDVVEDCAKVLDGGGDALTKMRALFATYYAHTSSQEFDRFLHLPQNADIHQRSLSRIVVRVTPLLEKIIAQGVGERLFNCGHTEECAEILLVTLAFLFDYGIFPQERLEARLEALAQVWERALGAKEGSFSFLKARAERGGRPASERQ